MIYFTLTLPCKHNNGRSVTCALLTNSLCLPMIGHSLLYSHLFRHEVFMKDIMNTRVLFSFPVHVLVNRSFPSFR